MAVTVEVKLGERSYPIRIGCGLPPVSVLGPQQVSGILIVSDSNVDPLYGAQRQQQFEALGFAVQRAVVPAGEPSKDWLHAAELHAQAVTAGLDRSALIVALGGGMVGDLAGFVAATFLRGVRLLQMPTTLLAMVDSAVGGKTGINLPQGKNLVGAFHQPVEVVAELTTLASLPEREYRAGLAEVVKYGVIWDAAFFARLEADVERLRQRDPEILEAVVARCCEIKAEVVAVDERESGLRAILNFGHTLAHALECVEGYGAWLHGEAVAVGMAYAAALSASMQGLSAQEVRRLTDLLQRLGLPVRPAVRGTVPPWATLRAAMRTDKKARRGALRWVLLRKLGTVLTGCEAPEAALEEAWHVCSQ